MHVIHQPPIRQEYKRARATSPNATGHQQASEIVAGTSKSLLVFLVSFIALGLVCGTANAYSDPSSIYAAGRVYVSSATLDPAVFFTGDKGTATFYVTNGNGNDSIVANHAAFGDKDIRLTSSTYDTSANIGPLQTRAFVFSVATDAFEGTYYPTFSLSLRDADSLYSRTPVKVDNTPLVLTIVDKPDTFTQDKKDSITVQIANPRENDVKNVVLEESGDSITATPSKIFIGALASGADMNSTFSITPGKESSVNITVNYDNGDNHHSVALTIPVTFGTDKKKATPQMSNVEVKLEGSVYHVTGDITNAGLTTANGVSVTALSPAVPEDPYKSYVIGALKPDDFGSYEVTFGASGATSVPLQISYKDADGNVITSSQDVSLNGVVSSDTTNQSGNTVLLPVIIVIVIIAIGGWYFYNKRRKNQ
jgi:hypothetical protein